MRLNNKGFNLLELVISSGLFILIIGGASLTFIYFVNIYKKKSENIGAEEAYWSAYYYLYRASSKGVGVRFAGNTNLRGTGSVSSEGYVRSISYTQLSDLPGTTNFHPLMYFNIERQGSGVSFTTSDIHRFALFFREPSPDNPGRLVFSYRNPAGGALITPQNSDLSIDGIVGVTLNNPIVSANNVIESIEMTLVFRTFNETSTPGLNQQWCPQSNLNSCPSIAPFTDIPQTFVLSFSNNKRDNDRTRLEFSNGAYLFNASGI